MNFSAIFIRKPVATMLLVIAITLAGAIAFRVLPVSPLPQVDFPTLSVNASLPGASPETMASSVATPLERQFGRIAGVTEMTSSSSLGSTSITLQFDLDRNIDAAGRDVLAAINAARGQLPANLPTNPNYRKVNPGDFPIIILSLTSGTYDQGQMYDVASTILQQKLSQIQGVGQVGIGGSSLPGVRVELDPGALIHYGIGLEAVRTMLGSVNINQPKGYIADKEHAWTIFTTDQLFKAKYYRPLVAAYHKGAAVRLSDLGDVIDSVEDVRNAALSNGRPSVLLFVKRQPGANIIDTVDRVKAILPWLKAAIPQGITIAIMMDQTVTIRAAVHDVERTMLISIILVILVVFVFLRSPRTTFIPSVVVPVSLIGTFGIMYLCGYSLDNLSLMALTISTGFVVDDAIVVIENITRYIEQGITPLLAAMRGAREIGFTVFSMSTSLIAVFIPILLMNGIVGRLFREFAVTLSAAIAVSLLVSLTATPMMCAKMLKPHEEDKHGRLYRATEGVFNAVLRLYSVTLAWMLHHARFTMALLFATIALNVVLVMKVPKGFFPQQDNGRMMGGIQGSQDISFQAMKQKEEQLVKAVASDPAVASVDGFTGGGGGGPGGGDSINTGRAFVMLKPIEERQVSVDQVINRLSRKLSSVPGATLFLQAGQDLRIGGRSGNAQYQYTLSADDLQELNEWSPRVLQALRGLPQITEVNTDQQNHGLSASVVYDRATASRLGISSQMIDNTLYDAFGQRQVSTIYTPLNQYHVVMEVAPHFWQDPSTLNQIYVRSNTGQQVPLSAFTRFSRNSTPLSVNHQSQFPAVTISFNLALGTALGDAVDAITDAQRQLGLPSTIRSSFQGTALAFQDSLRNEGILIIAALVSVYIMLGILYESYIHPITILSTLPSAGVGAILALQLCQMDLSVIALIGIILLIGLVKKNAIIMIDFALATQRQEGIPPIEAIYKACVLRFRPIMMTTMAAMLGGLPLALGTGMGSELRRPLGITIVGGLIVSQILTLYTTPVVYLYLDEMRLWWEGIRGRRRPVVSVARS
jgi:multidrug efflux pump